MGEFLDWTESYHAGAGVCGGKGYNLGRLARYGFRVPRGGVLPAGAPLSAVREGLERLGLLQSGVAVRSSATAEDSARASFAGIHRSFLSVRGTEAVEQAVQGCIDSLETPEAIAYRRRMGFRDEEVRCAVVICEMVAARSAGVAFSCDPATGRRDVVVIDAAEGLGDAVVSGRVNPRRSVWRNQTGRLVPEIEAAPCPWLPRAAEEELAYQAQRVQWALGDGWDPQDVEWAWDGERLWLLQARPVTHVPRPGWAETAAMPRYWSRANLKDNQPGISSDLSWSALDNVVGDALFGVMKLAGYAVPPGMQVVRRFHGRGYFDLTTMEYAFYDAFGIQPADIMRTIGGHQPQITVPPKPLSGAVGRRRLKAALRLLSMVWNHPRRAQAAAAKCIAVARKLAESDWSRASLADMAQGMMEVSSAEEAFIPVFALSNASSGPWQLGLEGMLKDPALVNRLQAGSGAVASAEHGYRLYEIASGKSTIEEFLRDFGHRAVYETEVENPRWIEDPSWILLQVETIRAHPPERDPREAAAEVRRNAEREVRRGFRWRAPLILWEARKLRDASAAREGAKSAMVSMIWPVRRIALESARRLVEAGLLDRPEQVFRFTSVDLKCYLRGWWDGSGARELTCDRELTRQRWLSEDCPEVITEAPDGAMVVEPPALETHAVGAGWVGMAVSPGAAVGPARVVRNPGDAAHLLPGDVLCAPSTDPGWTPLFLRASAIVIETGGYLSHGSIVAREYGIPAVANVPGILDAVRDGERLKVDGSRGRVVRDGE